MHLFFKHLSKNCNYCLYLHTGTYASTTTPFVNILLIYSHYKPSKPFFKGDLFFATPCIKPRYIVVMDDPTLYPTFAPSSPSSPAAPGSPGGPLKKTNSLYPVQDGFLQQYRQHLLFTTIDIKNVFLLIL